MDSRKKRQQAISQKVGEAVRARRLAMGISQEEFAERSGHHRTYIGFLERGERCPNVATLQQIADALGLNASELLREAGF